MNRPLLYAAMFALALSPMVVESQEIKDVNPPSGAEIGTDSRATGGPDAFGYTFADQAEADVSFDWIDITGTGTALGGGDDSGYPVTLGASFNFYGTDYTTMSMTTNGYLSTEPTDTGPDLSNDCPLPATPSTPASCNCGRIYPLHDDLTTTEMYYQYFAVCPRQNGRCGLPEDCSVFFWDDVNHFGGADSWQMEVILYHQTNDIVTQIGAGNSELGSGSTTGIQNDGATDGLTYACNTAASLPDSAAVQFYHPNDITSICQAAPVRVPSLGSIGVAIFVVMLGIVAFVVIRRRA